MEEEINIDNGLRQGCSIAPILFNLPGSGEIVHTSS